MAFVRLNDLVLEKEYCCKPEGQKCPKLRPGICYDGEYQCRYWKQEFIPLWKKLDEEKVRKVLES